MKNIQAQYTDLLEGKMSQANFLRNVRMEFPQYVSNVSSFDDSIKILKGKRILSEAKKSEGVYGHDPNAEVTLYPNFDTVNYTQLIKGMKFELAQMDEITDANMLLAKKMALKKLTKDPMAYRELVVANQKAVAEMDKTLKMKEVKKGDLVDKANGMKVLKKDAPAAANKSKKFTNKVEKIKQMTQTPKKAKGIEKVMEVPGKEKVVALKEAILREFENNAPVEHISKGARVMTRDKKKVGEVDKIEHDTATLKLDDGTMEHVQLNVLTARDVPAKQKKTDETINADQPNQMPMQHVKADDEKYKIVRDSKDKIIKATNGDNVEFQINDTAKLDPKDGGTEIKITGFQENQGKVKAFYLINGTGYTYDIDGLQAPKGGMKPGVDMGKSFEKLKSLKERLKKALKKEDLFKKGSSTVTAATPNSQAALKQQGYTQVPNTGDIKAL